MQFWTSTEVGNERIIAYGNKTIYKANPPAEEIAFYKMQIENGDIPEKKLIGIPLHYIKEIRLQEGTGYIEILFGADSTEQLRINNEETRNEVFQHFKSNIPDTLHQTDEYSILKAGKKPLIAMLITLGLFVWTLSVANGIEAGDQYTVRSGRSIASIVLLMASMGSRNVIIVFSVLLAIGCYAFIKKAKNPPVIHSIVFKR